VGVRAGRFGDVGDGEPVPVLGGNRGGRDGGGFPVPPVTGEAVAEPVVLVAEESCPTGALPSAPSLRPGGLERCEVWSPVLSTFHGFGGAGAASSSTTVAALPGGVGGGARGSRFGGGAKDEGSRSEDNGAAMWSSLRLSSLFPRPISPF
jgi:hypothetical protein